MSNYVVSISREFGSGGRLIGKITEQVGGLDVAPVPGIGECACRGAPCIRCGSLERVVDAADVHRHR